MKKTNESNNEAGKALEENLAQKKAEKSKNDLRKQLVSGGVYMALAVTVVAVTVSTITATFSEKSKPSGDKTLYRAPTPSAKENNDVSQTPAGEKRLSADSVTLDTPVSDSPSGVDATLTLPSLDSQKPEARPEQATPKSDTPQDAAHTEAKPKGDDKQTPRAEEPAEPTFEMGYDGYLKPLSGYINKDFSIDVPVYSATMFDYRTHAGVDIVGEPGTPIKAVSNGTITEVYNDDLYGTTVVVAHADGVESIYRGLSPELPTETVVGRSVFTGEVLAGLGNSALCESAEASHLHFEMHKDGVPVDPGDYIEF